MVREKDIENYLVKQCKTHGVLLRKCQWVGQNHCPDRLIMSPNLTVWVELKAPGKTARPGQVREHDRMKAAGQKVIVIDGFDGVDAIINSVKRMNSL